MKVIIPTRYELWQATASDNTRPVLKNICVDTSGTLPMAIATDSFILVAVPCAIEEQSESRTPALIPADLYKAAVCDARRRGLDKVGFEIEDKMVSVELLGGILRCEMPEGAFPAWRYILPSRESLAAVPYVSYNNNFVERIFKALDVFSRMNAIHQTGQKNPSIVVGGDGGFALIMPQFIDPYMPALDAVLKLKDQKQEV